MNFFFLDVRAFFWLILPAYTPVEVFHLHRFYIASVLEHLEIVKHHLIFKDELIYKKIVLCFHCYTVASIIIYTEGIICLKKDIFKLSISMLVNLHILTGIQPG